MLIKKQKRPLMMVLVAFFAVTLACRVEAPRIVMEESPTPTSQPTLIITQVVTEIITPTPQPVLPTSPPTQANEPTLTPTYDPFSVPIYYPLPDCVASRLHKGDTAIVSYQGGDNAIRYSPGHESQRKHRTLCIAGRPINNQRRTLLQLWVVGLVCRDSRWFPGLYTRR